MTSKGPSDVLLLAGGPSDPNLACLHQRARDRGDTVIPLFAGPGADPMLSWDLGADRLTFERQQICPGAAFIRCDVFGEFEDPRPQVTYRAHTWYSTVLGWALAHPNVALLNRASALTVTNKLLVLHWAHAAGLPIPQTVVTNDLERTGTIASKIPLIGKPVNGGGFCEEMNDVLPRCTQRKGRAASPSIVQVRLTPPEVRIYAVRGRKFAFMIEADALDYRTVNAPRIESIPLNELPSDLPGGLDRLLARMKLDFAAADFKLDAGSGDLTLLEVNNAPMFAVFDGVSNGQIADAILDTLLRADGTEDLSRRHCS